MIRGSTAPIIITMSGGQFTTYDNIRVTFRQGDTVVTLIPTVVNNTTLTVQMTQEQSLSFAPSDEYPMWNMRVQANWMIDGTRYSSSITEEFVEDQILDGVIQ